MAANVEPAVMGQIETTMCNLRRQQQQRSKVGVPISCDERAKHQLRQKVTLLKLRAQNRYAKIRILEMDLVLQLGDKKLARTDLTERRSLLLRNFLGSWHGAAQTTLRHRGKAIIQKASEKLDHLCSTSSKHTIVRQR